MIEKPQFTLLIRKLHPHESSLYRSIRLACLTNSPDQFGSTYAEEASTPVLKFETYIEQDLSGRFMFGAFDEGKLIGIAGFDRKERAARPAPRPSWCRCMWTQIIVGKESRRGCSGA